MPAHHGLPSPHPVRLAGDGAGSWPSFRGPHASGVAEHQGLPDTWNVKTGENVRWRTPIPGLAHSSPAVWGQKVFVTSAVSSDPNASFRPGLYGDGDASKDRSRHRWTIYALDKRDGKILWQRVAHEGEPLHRGIGFPHDGVERLDQVLEALRKKSDFPWFTILLAIFVIGGFAWGFYHGGLEVGSDLLLKCNGR